MPRDTIFKVRLAAAEDAALRQAATSVGLNRSEFIRFASLLDIRHTDDEDSAVLVDTTAMRRLFAEMNAWGVNFNQGVHGINRIMNALVPSELSDSEKRYIATNSKESYLILTECAQSFDTILTMLVSIAARNHITLPDRLLEKIAKAQVR
jgi:hypothetical protein